MDTVKEEIELAKQLLDEMDEVREAGNVGAVSGKANIVKTLMECIELSCVAYGLVNEDGIEPWDPDEAFCEFGEEYEDEDTPEKGE